MGSERAARSPLVAGSRVASALAALGLLPGCTAQLWSSYRPPAAQQRLELLSETRREVAGSAQAGVDVARDGLWLTAGDGSEYCLAPERGADVVAALLARPDLCTVERLAVDAQRGVALDDEVVADRARVTLQGRLHAPAIGGPVDRRDIGGEAAEVLDATRRNTFVLATAPELYLPPVLQQCVRRLPHVSLAQLVQHPATAAAFVFVDEDGRPWPSAEAPIPEALQDVHAPLADRLEALAMLRLLVRADANGHPVFVRLRPDHVFVAASLDVEQGRFVHASDWHLQTVPLPMAQRPPATAPPVDFVLALREQSYRTELHSPFDAGFWGRVAVTPIAVAFDLAFGPDGLRFIEWLLNGRPAHERLPPPRN